MLGIALWCLVVLLRTAPARRPVPLPAARRAVQVLVLACAVTAVADSLVVAADSLHRAAFVAATRGVLIVLTGLVVGSVLWLAAGRRRRSPRG